MKSVSEEFSGRLRELLERRLVIIADQELREKNPAEQLEQLRTVSEEIMAMHQQAKGTLPPRLEHYLDRASYQKALAWLKGEEA